MPNDIISGGVAAGVPPFQKKGRPEKKITSQPPVPGRIATRRRSRNRIGKPAGASSSVSNLKPKDNTRVKRFERLVVFGVHEAAAVLIRGDTPSSACESFTRRAAAATE
jgi:hypothetical protein